MGLSPAASAASGWMVNSTSATAAAEINEEECEQVGLSPTAGSGASKGVVFLLVTMIDVNSMLEMVESEVWLHGYVNSMVAAMELGGVVEGGLKLDASKGGETQMVRSTHAAYFNIKLVRQQKVRSMHERT